MSVSGCSEPRFCTVSCESIYTKSPSETVVEFRFNAPGHIATASVTRHFAKQSHVIQKLDAKVLVDEEICDK